jgi:phage-related protein
MSTGEEENERTVIVFLDQRPKSPPFARAGRIEAGVLLGRLQNGELLGMPISRPMSSIGPRCHELRVRDEKHNWRIFYRIDADAIVVPLIFAKTTQKTPKAMIDLARSRLAKYDAGR